ncbi:GntR family transcriptional regulator, transcriptional repressor for pyruvate dehydrogenase complex [Mesobacillus persicus]|uniref:GntR family transcriptional regulator, transcriptional repressor for pyruvate dehydrogenase complex n=1 Tax=Mesobacillus persicus TaxID=930146 RepID=A0A1H8D9D4_9BACI|nr:FadR/GntR family transcriptional regulator [Mesobacillus persicus]SEN03832.1 GntR family transcriptional regulator, transcriptional repressor for pyruvate dehydrogenase complex [Mesobacillus persicus]
MAEKVKVSQTISRELLNMIETGKYPPGSKLPTEMELAAHFGVSRIPIREALSVLRAAGVISSRQGGGSYVEERAATFLLHQIRIENDDKEVIKHLFEMRKILEPEAAYLAAIRRTPEQLEQMQKAMKWLEIEYADEEKTGREADIEFHQSIILATQNPIMIHTMESLSALYERALKITLEPNLGLKQRRKAVLKEHQDILLAIETEEPELAKIQSIIHLKNAEKKISLLF